MVTFSCTSWRMNSNREFVSRWATFAGRLVKKLSMQTISCPPCSSRSHKCEPKKPDPPVTKIRFGKLSSPRARSLADRGGSTIISFGGVDQAVPRPGSTREPRREVAARVLAIQRKAPHLAEVQGRTIHAGG